VPLQANGRYDDGCITTCASDESWAPSHQTLSCLTPGDLMVAPVDCNRRLERNYVARALGAGAARSATICTRIEVPPGTTSLTATKRDTARMARLGLRARGSLVGKATRSGSLGPAAFRDQMEPYRAVASIDVPKP